jgi:predicted transcriptional regulator
MHSSLAEMLGEDVQCEGLLACLHGLKALDEECYRELARSTEPLTVDEVADRVERERSTAYRSIERLLDAGLVEREQINYDHGGYYHVYRPADPEEVADRMQRQLNDWYAKIGHLVGKFRTEYDEDVEPSAVAEH